MAYPRYIGKSAFASGTGALTVAALTDTQAGDIIILFAESANQTINTPTEYSVLATQVGTGTAAVAGGVRIASFYRIMQDAADTSTTVADSGNHTTAIKMLFRDTSLADGSFYVTATSTQGTASTSMTFPAVTTATDESLVVLGVALDRDAPATTNVGAVTNANLTSITERHDETVAAGAGGGLAVITGEKATAGSTDTSTATGSTSVTRAYHTISLSRITAQTTTSTFNTVADTAYFPISDALRITAGSGGSISATSSGTFQPNTLTNGTYALNFKWYWRQLGTDTWTTSTAVASTVSALVSTGILDTVGEFTDNETITGLTNGVEYEVVLFAARNSATPANTISFSATATISNPKSITAETGAYTYSGNNANVLFNRRVIAEAGSYSYSGNAANVLYNRRIAADPASFSYSGNNAGLLFNRKVIADVGSFVYSGNNAGLLYSRILTADAGTYTYSGNNATLTYTTVGGYTLTADAGSFSYSGNNANLTVGFKIVADTGTYSYSGNAANLLSGRKVIADTGSYSYSGNAASVLYNRKVVANTGSYSYSGNAASILYNRKLIAAVGSFTYSGNAANISFTGAVSKIYFGTLNISNLKYGSFNIYEAYLGSTQVWGKPRPVNTMIAETLAYTYTGNNATLRVGKTLAANGASYSLAGNNSLLKYGRKLVADAASYTYSGNNAVLSTFYTMTRYATVFDNSGNGSSSITAVFNTNGTISFITSSGDDPVDTDFTHWHDGGTVTGIGNSRWAKRTLISGDAVAGTLDTTLVALSASKTIAIQTVAGEGKSGEVLIEIYSDSGGTTKVGQITLTITATL